MKWLRKILGIEELVSRVENLQRHLEGENRSHPDNRAPSGGGDLPNQEILRLKEENNKLKEQLSRSTVSSVNPPGPRLASGDPVLEFLDGLLDDSQTLPVPDEIREQFPDRNLTERSLVDAAIERAQFDLHGLLRDAITGGVQHRLREHLKQDEEIEGKPVEELLGMAKFRKLLDESANEIDCLQLGPNGLRAHYRPHGIQYRVAAQYLKLYHGHPRPSLRLETEPLEQRPKETQETQENQETKSDGCSV